MQIYSAHDPVLVFLVTFIFILCHIYSYRNLCLWESYLISCILNILHVMLKKEVCVSVGGWEVADELRPSFYGFRDVFSFPF